MRLLMLYVEKEGRRVPVGTVPADSCDCLIRSLPNPREGIKYLQPVEITDPERVEHASREYSQLAQLSHDGDERQDALGIATSLHELADTLKTAE